MDPPATAPPVLERRTFLRAAAALPVVLAGMSRFEHAWASDAETCEIFTSTPSFLGVVPSPERILGSALGTSRITSDDSDTYLSAVAAASDRVIAGSHGRSVNGRLLRYAIVGNPENLTSERLASIRADVAAIRDPVTPPATVASLAQTTPGILWIVANMHGDEPSGCDAALQVLYELSDRDDCGVTTVLDNAIVLIIPTQNPDGRDATTRQNANGFDLNRDLFARTQPETDGKVELMRRYPPLVLVDSHESGYSKTFFPPNSDPIYHEITDQYVDQIRTRFGPAMARAFRDKGYSHAHGLGYDFFSPEYNDTVASQGFLGIGMTVEVDGGEPLAERVDRQLTADLSVLAEAARSRRRLLLNLHEAAVTALAEGTRGVLEPNAREFRPAAAVVTAVPKRRVRDYFILNEPSKTREAHALLRRLQRMNVKVYRLDEDLAVPGYRSYGSERPHEATMLAGTYWIPMAQPQKHWIQAMLNEDTYLPTHTTYSLSGWSSPLLMNLQGGSSGGKLAPVATLVGGLGPVPAPHLPEVLPTIGVFQISAGSYADESAGATRWVLGDWGAPFTDLVAADIVGGGLAGIDVLLVPGGGSHAAIKHLGETGRRALVAWVRGGGRYVGYRWGGARLASTLGLTTTEIQQPQSWISGSLVRAVVDPSSPLTAGVGDSVWVLYDHDLVLRPSRATAPVRYPGVESPEAFVSGYSVGWEDLAGTAVVTDEPFGLGRVILFGADPAYRAFAEGTQRLLFNATFGAGPG